MGKKEAKRFVVWFGFVLVFVGLLVCFVLFSLGEVLQGLGEDVDGIGVCDVRLPENKGKFKKSYLSGMF